MKKNLKKMFMKKVNRLLIIFNFMMIGFLMSACQNDIKIDLIGQWQVVEHNGEEVVEFNPYYHHFLIFNEDNTFKMQSSYDHPNQDFDYKRGWFPRISNRLIKLYSISNLVGTYTFENNIITLYDQNQEPFSHEMIYELKGSRISRVSENSYAKFVYEKCEYVPMQDTMQGTWHLDITSTNKLSEDDIVLNGIMKIKIFNDYISFYGLYSPTSTLSVKCYPGESTFLLLFVDTDELVIGYIVENAMHIVSKNSFHLVYIKEPETNE